MNTAEKLSITLPGSLARLVRDKVATGAYASNSEVIREALRVWQERERGIESIRDRLAEAVNDPRPPRAAKDVSERLDRLHQETVRRSDGR